MIIDDVTGLDAQLDDKKQHSKQRATLRQTAGPLRCILRPPLASGRHTTHHAMASPAAHPLNTAFLQWVSAQLQGDPAANLATGAADYLAYVDEYKRRSGASGSPGTNNGTAGTPQRPLLHPGSGPGFLFTLPREVAPTPGAVDGGAGEEEDGDAEQQRHSTGVGRQFGDAASEPPAPPGANPWAQSFNPAEKVCAQLLACAASCA